MATSLELTIVHISKSMIFMQFFFVLLDCMFMDVYRIVTEDEFGNIEETVDSFCLLIANNIR